MKRTTINLTIKGDVDGCDSYIVFKGVQEIIGILTYIRESSISIIEEDIPDESIEESL